MHISIDQFKPIGYGVQNCVIDVKPNVNLSVSYGTLLNSYIGKYGNFEVAVQLNHPNFPYRCLVQLSGEDSNVISNVSFDDLDGIIERARNVIPKGLIEILDKDNEWKFRFFTDESEDERRKLDYVKRVFKEGRFRYFEDYFLENPGNRLNGK